jgi:hypothetical protein
VRCTPITALVLSSIVFAPVSARAQYDEKNFEVPLMEAIERVLGK